MAFSDWLRETIDHTRSDGAKFALKHAAHMLYLGGVRRLSPFFPDGVSYWSDEWDVLIILDACRPDLMQTACTETQYGWLPFSEKVKTLRSPGSTSHEWMDAHFKEVNRECMAGTAYITANLFIQNYEFGSFAEFCQIEAEEVDGLHVAPPRPLTDRAIDIWRQREELDVDKLIVHYMQPHTPFRSKSEWFEDVDALTGWGNGFVRLRDGKLPADEFWEAYLDNLLWVLEDVDLLVKNCDADIVVTSDHGNGLGEWGIYGHPNGIPFNVVRKVPWIRIDGQDQNTYTPDLPDGYLNEKSKLETDDIVEQLQALGYKE